MVRLQPGITRLPYWYTTIPRKGSRFNLRGGKEATNRHKRGTSRKKWAKMKERQRGQGMGQGRRRLRRFFLRRPAARTQTHQQRIKRDRVLYLRSASLE